MYSLYLPKITKLNELSQFESSLFCICVLTMAEGEVILTAEQKFTNTLFEYLETTQKCVIWKRDKYDCILEKVKSGKKETSQDYYYQQR